MKKLKVEKHIVGPIATNCYFIINEDTDEILIVDPGAEPLLLINKAETAGFKPLAVLLTHGHFDHAGAAGEMSKKFGIKIYAFEEERRVLEDPSLNLSAAMMARPEEYFADIYLKDNEETRIGEFRFLTFHTPGHTPGGCGFYFPEEGILFSGDTLFFGSVGRTDFPGGSMSGLLRSVKERFFTLPLETRVYTGHGEETTIGFEKENNPFVS